MKQFINIIVLLLALFFISAYGNSNRSNNVVFTSAMLDGQPFYVFDKKQHRWMRLLFKNTNQVRHEILTGSEISGTYSIEDGKIVVEYSTTNEKSILELDDKKATVWEVRKTDKEGKVSYTTWHLEQKFRSDMLVGKRFLSEFENDGIAAKELLVFTKTTLKVYNVDGTLREEMPYRLEDRSLIVRSDKGEFHLYLMFIEAKKLSVWSLFEIMRRSGQATWTPTKQTTAFDADILIVGAGISGLSAALEAARGGAKVTVIDMFSVFGGVGVISQGGICLIDSPVQQALGIKDTPELAYKDFMAWGEDGDIDWIHYYINNSISEIYHWLTNMGVVFEEIWQLPGNSVPRFHNVQGRGLGLIAPIYRECVKHPNIQFIWNSEVKELIVKDAQIIGLKTEHLRTEKKQYYYAPVIILATGGFQNNLDMVRENWPKGFPFPDRLLLGSGINSTGSGHKMANKIGADLSNLDHQWNYVTGLPDPNNLDTDRGLQVKNKGAIWVNAQGERFVSEYNSARNNFPALMIQIPPTYWAIFDEKSKYNLFVSGSGWSDFKRIQEIILDNQNLVKTSSTIEGLATLTTLPIKLLTDTVQHYNEMVDKKVDKDFNRFDLNLSYQPHKITQPPFYAIQFFPMTRKSMGGVVIDNSCHVLDQKQHRIPGLYAVGELTGVAGINGKAALEGTFLGPSIVTGRIAARSALSELNIKLESTIESNMTTNISKAVTAKAKNLDCMNCHDFTLRRMGYWHFEKSHAVVQERQYQCLLCHAKSNSHTKEEHKINPLAQIENCTICH